MGYFRANKNFVSKHINFFFSHICACNHNGAQYSDIMTSEMHSIHGYHRKYQLVTDNFEPRDSSTCKDFFFKNLVLPPQRLLPRLPKKRWTFWWQIASWGWCWCWKAWWLTEVQLRQTTFIISCSFDLPLGFMLTEPKAAKHDIIRWPSNWLDRTWPDFPITVFLGHCFEICSKLWNGNF